MSRSGCGRCASTPGSRPAQETNRRFRYSSNRADRPSQSRPRPGQPYLRACRDPGHQCPRGLEVLLALRRGVDRLPARRVTPAVAARVGVGRGSCGGASEAGAGPRAGGRVGSCEDQKQVADVDRRPGAHRDVLNHAVPRRPKLVLHLHRLDDEQLLAGRHRITWGDRDADHDPGDDGMDPGRPAPLRCRPVAACLVSKRCPGGRFKLDLDAPAIDDNLQASMPAVVAPATIAGAVRPRARRWMWTG